MGIAIVILLGVLVALNVFIIWSVLLTGVVAEKKTDKLESLIENKIDDMERSLKDKLNGFLIVFQKSRDLKE